MIRICALLAIAVACGGTSPRVDPIAASSTRAAVEVGNVVAVEEIGDTTIVLDETRAFTLRGGTLAAAVEHPWTGGAVVPAPDGEGRWATGTDPDGRLWRITIAGELEDVTDRFAIGGSRVLAVGSAGTTMAVALGDATGFKEIAVSADGVHVTRVEAAGSRIAVGRGRLAVASPRGVAVWDLATSTARDFAITDARAIAFFDSPTASTPSPTGSRLAIATESALWIESGETLHRIASPTPIRALTAAGSRLWLLTDASASTVTAPTNSGRLYALEREMLRPVAIDSDTQRPDGRHPAEDDRKPQPRALATAILGSPSGDVWVASPGALIRASIDGAVVDPAWQSQIAPVFARVCAHCHRPGGEADIDLSTAASWNVERDEIRKRVIETRTMPPAGTDLSDADRAAITAWLGAH